MRTREEWAEDHGYFRFRCPECGKRDWTDTTPVCSCGYGKPEEKQEAKEDGE